MELGWHLRNALRRLSGKKTLEEERLDRLMGIRRRLDHGEVDRRDPMYHLITDYSLDSIVISKFDGTVIIGNGGSRIETVNGSALFEYVKNKLPDVSYLMVKTKKGTRVIYTDGEYIYIARAPGYVSPLEMKLIARKVRSDVDGR